MHIELPRAGAVVAPGIRPFAPGDESGLGVLLYHAYLGTIDQEEETLEQAKAEVRKTISGEYGAFMPRCSMVMPRDGPLVPLASATLITRFQERPFVAFSLTAPDHKNQGLARACLLAAMAELADSGEHELRLVVTLANAPAYHLYKSLGFNEEPR
jgi:ribosomal protein S18 acetylase RimI-like enzyme